MHLTRGQRAIIDADDLRLVEGKKWQARRSNRTWYATSNCTTLMHRLVLGAVSGTIVDHRDGNGLNNTRKNLRFVTPLQNTLNRHFHDGSSRFRGVAYHKGTKKWETRISHYGKQYYLGLYTTEEDAARAYDAKAFELHGDDACLNFPAPSPLGSRGGK